MNDKTAAATQPHIESRTQRKPWNANGDFLAALAREIERPSPGPSRGELHGIDLTQLPEKRG